MSLLVPKPPQLLLEFAGAVLGSVGTSALVVEGHDVAKRMSATWFGWDRLVWAADWHRPLAKCGASWDLYDCRSRTNAGGPMFSG